MLTTIKGVYKNGIVKPLEEVHIKEETKVIITFLGRENKNNDVFISAAGSWKDLDTEKIKKRIYYNRKLNSRKKAEL